MSDDKPAGPIVRQPLTAGEVLKWLDLGALVSKMMPLHRRNNRPFLLFGRCPFCETHGDLEIVVPQQMFFTQCCRQAGNAYAFMRLSLGGGELDQNTIWQAISALILEQFKPDLREIVAAHDIPTIKEPNAGHEARRQQKQEGGPQ